VPYVALSSVSCAGVRVRVQTTVASVYDQDTIANERENETNWTVQRTRRRDDETEHTGGHSYRHEYAHRVSNKHASEAGLPGRCSAHDDETTSALQTGQASEENERNERWNR
jgi:hypothetical protein